MRHAKTLAAGLAFGFVGLLAVSCGTTTAVAPNFTVKGANKTARLADRANAGSPTTANVTMYAVYLSPNTDCTAAVLAGGDGTTAVTKDMVTNPVLFTGNPGGGTYKCIILKMSDNISFKPDATAAAAFASCVAGTASTFDIYRADTSSTWRDKDGGTTPAHGTHAVPASDTVFIFASTVPADVAASTIHASPDQTLTLTAPFTIPATGSFTATFTTDFVNKVTQSSDGGGDGNHCWMDPGPFTITGS